MSLIDRRLGLLFAAFVVLFFLVLVRAAWLQAVRGWIRVRRGRTQPADSDGHGAKRPRGDIRPQRHELAVSEEAASVIATPYQVEDPLAAAAKLAPVLGVNEGELLKQLADPGRASSIWRARSICRRLTRSAACGSRGSASCRTAAASTPRASWPRR